MTAPFSYRGRPLARIRSYFHERRIAFDIRLSCYLRKLRRKLVYRPAALKARRAR